MIDPYDSPSCAPPEWAREFDREVISDGRQAPSCSMAETLNCLAAVLLDPGDPRATRHGPRPASTQGGQGRAFPRIQWRRKLLDGEQRAWGSAQDYRDGYVQGGSNPAGWVAHPPRDW